MKKQKQAFTLVELIVVITILAILGTVAFISLQGYTRESRDSKRLSDINNIQKKIGIEIVKGTNLTSLINLVKTNSGLTINSASGTSIQGTANFQALKEDGTKFKDPITKGDYVVSYSIGGTGTGTYKFTQVSTINEEKNEAVVKGNYYQMQGGDSPSIIKNNSNIFVVDEGSELPYLASAGLGGGSSSSGGPIGWMTLDTNCDIPDITVGTQTWAGCNSTLGNGFEYGQTNADIGTSNYNGTVSSCYNYSGDNTGICTKGDVTMSSNSKANSWYSGTNINGDTEYNTIWGKLYTFTSTASACPAGWHVPSDLEWEYAEEYLHDEINPGTAPNNCRNTTDQWRCDSIGWNSANGTKSRSLANKLKIPLAGYRNSDSSSFVRRGDFAYLWSSTPFESDFGYYRSMDRYSSTIYMDYTVKYIGQSVRCLKD